MNQETPPAGNEPGLRPPQFSLSALLILMTLLGLVFTLASQLGPYGAFVLGLLLLSILAHVAGNALGTQLRSSSRHSQPRDGAAHAARRRPLTDHDYAPPTRLSHRTPLGWWNLLVTSLAALLAGALGCAWIYRVIPSAPLTTLVAATLAFGALGGIWGFLTVSLFQVTLGAWWQALKSHSNNSHSAHPKGNGPN